MGAKKPGRAGLSQSADARASVLVVALGRRHKALQAAQEIFLAHAVEGDLGVVATARLDTGRRGGGSGRDLAEQRNRFGFRLIDFDILLQGMGELLLEVVRSDRLVRDLAQRDDRVLVPVAVDRQRGAGRDQAGAVAREQHELEPVLDLVDAIFDGHASHARLLSGCFDGGGKRAMYTQTGAETTLSSHHGRRWMAAATSCNRVGTRPWKSFHGPWNVPRARLDLPDRLCDVRRFDGAAWTWRGHSCFRGRAARRSAWARRLPTPFRRPARSSTRSTRRCRRSSRA